MVQIGEGTFLRGRYSQSTLTADRLWGCVHTVVDTSHLYHCPVLRSLSHDLRSLCQIQQPQTEKTAGEKAVTAGFPEDLG